MQNSNTFNWCFQLVLHGCVIIFQLIDLFLHISEKVRLESHSSSRMKTDSRVSIQWDYKDFGIQFESNGPAFKLRRAPSATLGEPWPLPQVYRTDIRKVYRINENTFHINTENYTCQILQNAIQRYTDSIFKYALEEFNENLKYLKNGGFNHKRLDNINEEDSTITEMVISLRMPCQSYPDENSDESCEYTYYIYY